jgi:hypothetical protein
MNDLPAADDVLGHYRVWDPPARLLDPREASAQLLQAHGLPRRPDPDAEPHLARIWERAFTRPITTVRAELSVDERMRRNPLHRHATEFDDFLGWGGAIVNTPTPATDPAVMVYGEWVIPTVIGLNPTGHDMLVGFWVGLDGWEAVGAQVLQAGIAAYVSDGDVEWYAWTEWFTGEFQDPPVKVDNFPISPGDTITVLVWATAPDFGHIVISNMASGRVCTIGITARPGITSAGASTEWVIEAPRAALPYFYSFRFTSCAGATEHTFFDLDRAFVSNLTGADTGASTLRHQLTESWIETPTQAVVQWKDFE